MSLNPMPQLRKCDTGEINCFVCIGRDDCEEYSYEITELGRKEFKDTLDNLSTETVGNIFDIL